MDNVTEMDCPMVDPFFVEFEKITAEVGDVDALRRAVEQIADALPRQQPIDD